MARSRWPSRVTSATQVRRGPTEGLMALDRVPNGSLYITLTPKHRGSPTGESRSVAITDMKSPPSY